MRGLNNTIQILVSISFGQKDYKKCEDVLQLGRLLSIIAFIPMILMAFATYRVLTFIGVEEEVAAWAHDYTAYLYPGMFIYIQFDTYKQYLNVTQYNKVVLFSNIISISVHVLLCHTFITVWELPVNSVALALCLSNLTNFMLVATYSKFCLEHSVSYFGFTNLKLLKWFDVN